MCITTLLSYVTVKHPTLPWQVTGTVATKELPRHSLPCSVCCIIYPILLDIDLCHHAFPRPLDLCSKFGVSEETHAGASHSDSVLDGLGDAVCRASACCEPEAVRST